MGGTSRTTELLKRRDQVVPRGVARLNDVCLLRAEGARVIDAEGRSLIDFAGGIGVVNAGHCPADVVSAVRMQADRLLHSCIHVATYPGYLELCETLTRLLPHGDATRAVLVNSGAEAVENAIKIARHYTGRPAVIAFTGAFHGRTLLGLTLTSKSGYKIGAGPYAPEIYRLDFPDPTGVDQALRQLEEAFVHRVPATQVAAILIEPVPVRAAPAAQPLGE